MTALDAKALHDDPAGLAFLRDVIASNGAEPAVKPRGFGVAGHAIRPAKGAPLRRASIAKARQAEAGLIG